jgi:hypothetical protein
MKYVLTLILLVISLLPTSLAQAEIFSVYDSQVSYAMASPELMANVKGRILLDVQRNGEAWYVEPIIKKRYYLGRADDAYAIMRGLGVGITTSDLRKIPIGYYKMSGNDSDGDGLVDTLETALGTNLKNIDSDGDGYNDYQEIINNYSPTLGSRQKLPIDLSFADSQKGRIFLQVQDHGEAWYINPSDRKRYYLGRAEDAYSIMRSLSLGITSANLSTIPIGTLSSTIPGTSSAKLTVDSTCSTADEIQLANIINQYRQTKNLNTLPISKSLSYVAKVHIDDLIIKKPYLGDCNQHSWSISDLWTGYCIKDGETNTLGHIKGRELNTGYNSDIYEIANSIWQGTNETTRVPVLNVNVEDHLRAWQNSHGHNIMIINQEGWSRLRWEVMGVAVKENFALVWYGTEEDAAGLTSVCR